MSLVSGTLIADRFEIERLAGQGGMGAVYRARDRRSGEPVALKLLQEVRSSLQEPERFTREAQLLSELCHPGIVSYVSHGETADGQRFLAMEWLEGEDLAQRLLRGPLSVPDCVTLLEQVAAALSIAHQSGVVHRDLKPTNLFLVSGQVARVKVLDFGIARRLNTLQAVTQTGMVIGTPEYMAPEQARGSREVTPAADVFSLGCVLYECLTGQPPFCGEHIAAVLVRILFEEPPPLCSRRPGVSEPMEQLLRRMLLKDPLERLQDAEALAASLTALGVLPEVGLASTLAATAPVLSLPEQEQQLFSVVLATQPLDSDGRGSTLKLASATAELERRRSIQKTLASLGARAEWLLDGSLVVAVAAGSATDQVAQAARVAILIKDRWPESEVALATGRGSVRGALPVGEVVDRATQLLDLRAGADADSRSSGGVWVDDVSAGLLGRRFALNMEGGRTFLSGEELNVDDTRPLLGKPTPCVGREQELTTLSAILTSCIEESEARAGIITAMVGMGKSRLRHEFLRRVRSNHANVTVLLGVGDMVSAGAPYGILGQALRRWCEITGSEPQEVQRHRLATRLGPPIADGERLSTVDFLGELCGIPFPDGERVKLRAARQDPRLMRDQITTAFLAWLAAECRRAPVLLVLEDLHWGDALTVALLDNALREQKDQPLMILGFARPEVHDLFPKLWHGHSLKELPLGYLGKKACERLIHQVLGKEVSGAVVARLLTQSEGNAFYLEELIRAVGEGKGDALPQTVLAMLQARMGRLDAGSRQLLRLGSVFGETFWDGGVRALLAGERPVASVDSLLARLITSEMIELCPSSRFDGEKEYRFRHALVREAAYSLLGDEARPACHRMAGRYLEQRGEHDPMILAEHFYRGSESARAVVYYIRAAEQAFERYDLAAAIARATKGLTCDPKGESLGALLSVQTSAYLWSGNTEASYRIGHQALPLLSTGNRPWCMTMMCLITAATALAKPQEQFSGLVQKLISNPPTSEGMLAYAEALAFLVIMMSAIGQQASALNFLQYLRQMMEKTESQDLSIELWFKYAIGWYRDVFESDPWQTLVAYEDGLSRAELIGSRRMIGNTKFNAGLAELRLGELAHGEQRVQSGLRLLFEMNDSLSHAYCASVLALYLSEQCDDSKLVEIQQLANYLQEKGGAAIVCEASAHFAISALCSYQGQYQEAEEAIRKATALMQHLPPTQLLCFVSYIRLLLNRGRVAEAKEIAEQGLRALHGMGGCGFAVVKMRLAAAEAFRAVGESEQADQELRETLRQIRLRAEQIPNLAYRTKYLNGVPDNIRARKLASDWLGHDPFG